MLPLDLGDDVDGSETRQWIHQLTSSRLFLSDSDYLIFCNFRIVAVISIGIITYEKFSVSPETGFSPLLQTRTFKSENQPLQWDASRPGSRKKSYLSSKNHQKQPCPPSVPAIFPHCLSGVALQSKTIKILNERLNSSVVGSLAIASETSC